MIYVLMYPEFEPALADRLYHFRHTHEPDRAKLVPPHITLVFGVDPAHRSGLLEACDAAAHSRAPFEVTFSHSVSAYDPFEAAHKLFLICDRGSDAIITLHRQLYAGLPDTAKSDVPFTPHMTVATNPDPKYISHLDAGDIGPFPITSRVQSLTVVQFDGARLTVVKQLPFSG